MSEKPSQLADAELWQMRALLAEQARIKSELELRQMQAGEIQKALGEFSSMMARKYGSSSRAYPDGRIEYIDPPVPPTIPEPIKEGE